MPHKSISFRLIYLIFLSISLISCFSEKEKQPVFISNIDLVLIDIKKVIDFQEIKFVGSEQSLSNKSYGLLAVEIINPPIAIEFNAIPKNDSTLQEIGRGISFLIKRNLKDSTEYRYYNIKFIHKEHNLFNSSTTRNYLYESSDL